MSADNGLSCPEMEALAPELAIGTLAGTERAAALVHLETCVRCRALVDDLAATADALLLLAPEAEPPIGFESRAAARIAQAAAQTPSRQSGARVRSIGGLRRVIAVAAAFFVAGGLAGGAAAWWASDHHHATPAAAAVRTAVVDVAGGYTCHAVAVGTRPSWVYVTIEQPEEHDGAYVVQAVTGKANEVRPVGTVEIRDGRGSLGVPLDVDLRDLRTLRVLDAGGQVRYEAPFAAAGATAAPTTVAGGWG